MFKIIEKIKINNYLNVKISNDGNIILPSKVVNYNLAVDYISAIQKAIEFLRSKEFKEMKNK